MAFGDLVTADHVIFNERDMSHDKKRALLAIFDRATRWLEAFPSVSKDSATTEMALKDFAGTIEPKLLYTDNSRESTHAAKQPKWKHYNSTGNRPATNGVIERQNRNILDGVEVRPPRTRP